MKIRFLPLIPLTVLGLSACTLVEVEEAPVEQPTEQEPAPEPVRETNNVTYTGVVQPAGISIYQQGSHRLVLPGGKFILLESDTLDLNGYVGESVTIFGALRPTVEAGGMIMRVERIELTEPKEESSSSAQSTTSSSSSSADMSSDASTSVSSMSSSVALEESSSTQSEDSASSTSTEEAQESVRSEEAASSEETSSSEESSVASSQQDTAMLERIEVMARQDYAAATWTQQYCSSHIAFCAPVHKNWWFKSFGATNSSLWHVEFSSEPIEVLGAGPISLVLYAGSNADSSGTVEVANGTATGYVEWTFGRHFRISGDEKLVDAITYITENITEYTQ